MVLPDVALPCYNGSQRGGCDGERQERPVIHHGDCHNHCDVIHVHDTRGRWQVSVFCVLEVLDRCMYVCSNVVRMHVGMYAVFEFLEQFENQKYDKIYQGNGFPWSSSFSYRSMSTSVWV